VLLLRAIAFSRRLPIRRRPFGTSTRRETRWSSKATTPGPKPDLWSHHPARFLPQTGFFSFPFADVFTVSGGKIIRHAAYLGQYGVPRSLALHASRSGSHNLPAELMQRRALVEW